MSTAFCKNVVIAASPFLSFVKLNKPYLSCQAVLTNLTCTITILIIAASFIIIMAVIVSLFWQINLPFPWVNWQIHPTFPFSQIFLPSMFSLNLYLFKYFKIFNPIIKNLFYFSEGEIPSRNLLKN